MIPYRSPIEASHVRRDPPLSQGLPSAVIVLITTNETQIAFPASGRYHDVCRFHIKKILKLSILKGGSSIRDFKNTEGKSGNFRFSFTLIHEKPKLKVRS